MTLMCSSSSLKGAMNCKRSRHEIEAGTASMSNISLRPTSEESNGVRSLHNTQNKLIKSVAQLLHINV